MVVTKLVIFAKYMELETYLNLLGTFLPWSEKKKRKWAACEQKTFNLMVYVVKFIGPGFLAPALPHYYTTVANFANNNL